MLDTTGVSNVEHHRTGVIGPEAFVRVLAYASDWRSWHAVCDQRLAREFGVGDFVGVSGHRYTDLHMHVGPVRLELTLACS